MVFRFLRERDRQPEVMDQPGLDPLRHHDALAGLSRINYFSGSARILWPSILRLAREHGRPLRALDVATGAGDVPIRLHGKARRADLKIQWTGYDVSPTALEHARSAARQAGADIDFQQRDVLNEGIAAEFDLITCSLFLHHLETDDAVRLLRSLRQSAQHLLLINDLVRCRLGYLLAVAGSRLLTRSRVVHIDGPLSVRAALTPMEALALAEKAGLNGAMVERRWPSRFLMSWRRP